MSAAAPVIGEVVNTARYLLPEPESPALRSVVSRVQHELRDSGCSILTDFVHPSLSATLTREGAAVAPRAYFTLETVNAYNIATDTALPPDHPGRVTFERGNAFVSRDQIPADHVIHRLYSSAVFQQFVARCFGLPEIHELADPLAALCLNVLRPGMEHPWHFDTNEFTVSMITQRADAGGDFEYCPNIRSADAENLGAVRDVLDGRGAHMIRRLSLRPGDIQLFKGRYSLHRVSTVRGGTERHSAILAYSERPGVIGNVARTRQLFGRVRPAHLEAEGREVRVDQLLD